MENFTFSTDMIHFTRSLNLWWDESGIGMESDSALEADDIYLYIGGNVDLEIASAGTQFEVDGSISFTVKYEYGQWRFCVSTTGFSLNGMLYVEYGEFTGELNVFFYIIGTWCVGIEIG